jgi:hypothetical protein
MPKRLKICKGKLLFMEEKSESGVLALGWKRTKADRSSSLSGKQFRTDRVVFSGKAFS